jgi:hypothetical protein
MNPVKRPVAVAALTLAFLAGCAPTPPAQSPEEQLVNITEARDALRALLDETKALVGGGEWESRVSGARGCTLADGSQGVAIQVTELSSEGSSDKAQAISDVKHLWGQNGVTASEERDDESGLSIAHLGDVGYTLEFRAGDDSMSVGGVTACLPGDRREVNDQLG